MIGITEVVITPEMVGKKVGIFTAIEVKPPGFKVREHTPNRVKLHRNVFYTVRGKGGFGGFATSGDDLRHVISHFINWLKS